MNIVQSRFACLNIDDDDISNKNAGKRGPKENQDKVLTSKSQKKTTNNKQSQNQNNNSKKKVPRKNTEKQWEEWKEKDKKIVDGRYEEDLENAILQSKIHFEQDKGKNKGGDGGDPQKKTDKKKKSKTISLDEFLTGEATKPQKVPVNVGSCGDSIDANFFDKICKDAKSEMTKDKLNERVRERQLEIDDVITASQYQEKLTIERKKNDILQLELNKTKDEIRGVKERNKTLYTLLSTGEMKGKVEIINELEKLNVIKDELTQEVTRLHCLLEQERSKVAALMDTKHKKNGKKHS